jgi:hypothetical protein
MSLSFGPQSWGFLAFQLGIIYLLPIYLRHKSVDGMVSPQIMYAFWWIAGMLPIVHDLLANMFGRVERESNDVCQRAVRRIYVGVPWILFVAHLGFSHWAHHSPFVFADLSPALLGLMVASTHMRLPRDIQVIGLLLPVLAFIFSLDYVPVMSIVLPAGQAIHSLPPPLLTAIGLLMAYANIVSLWACMWMGVALLGFGLLYALQDAVVELIRFAVRSMAMAMRFGVSLLPTSAGGWGTISVVLAFVMLAVGAATGLKKKPEPAD